MSRHHQLRSQIRLIIFAWVFGSFWLWTITGAVMTRFAREMGTPDYGFGILAALPFLATLCQLPASYVIDRTGRRKLLFLVFMIISRAMWAVTAAVPWLLPEARSWWWPLMIVSIALAWMTNHVGVPAWLNWMSDAIPRRIRGRVLAQRRRIAGLVTIIVTLGIGWALDIVEQVRSQHTDMMLKVTSTILIIAALSGMIDVLMFRRIEDRNPPPPRRQTNWLGNLFKPLAMANFRRYLLFNFTFALATGFVGQYIWLYVFDVGHMSNWQANLVLIALPGVVHLLAYPLWGRLIDRVGRKPVLVIGSIGMMFTPIGWIVVANQTHLWIGYLLVIIGFVSFPGLEIANLNIMLDLARRRDDHSSGTTLVAVNSIAIAIGGAMSGFIAATCAHWLVDFEWIMPVLGLTLTYHGLLMLMSSALRGVATLWIIRLHEQQAAPTRDVIRYMTVSMYGNVRQALLMPTRVLGQIYRRSYRMRR